MVGAAFAVWGDVVGFDAVGLSWLFVVEVGVAAGAVFESVVFGLLYESFAVAEVGAGAGAAGGWSHCGSWLCCALHRCCGAGRWWLCEGYAVFVF